jgi:multisubunit Na+/H+ antiporter MnhC subunit
MNIFELPSNGKSADWLIFAVMLTSIGLGIAVVVICFVMFRTKNKRKRKRRHRHTRQRKPTLAQTGGLPPVRDPNQPPAGT